MTNAVGSSALRTRAIVDVAGQAAAGSSVIQATRVTITFPDDLNGMALGVWSTSGTFYVGWTANNVVLPQPDRYSVYYDNLDAPHAPLIVWDMYGGATVKARGYVVTGGVETFWISLTPISATGEGGGII